MANSIVRESDIETKVKKWCKNHGILCIKIVPISMVGFPDRMILTPTGKVMFMELKAPGKTPRKNQEKWLAKLTSFNIKACWFDNHEHAIDEIKRLAAA